MIQEVQDPRQYGVAEVAEASREIFKVKRVEEKPSKPVSRLAIIRRSPGDLQHTYQGAGTGLADGRVA
jgi:UTP-glucose-1-phosphate uridylyltransferase